MFIFGLENVYDFQYVVWDGLFNLVEMLINWCNVVKISKLQECLNIYIEGKFIIWCGNGSGLLEKI